MAKRKNEKASVQCLDRLFYAMLFAAIVGGTVAAVLNSVYSHRTVEIVPTKWIIPNATHTDTHIDIPTLYSLKTTHAEIVKELLHAENFSLELRNPTNATRNLFGDAITLQFASKGLGPETNISLKELASVKALDFHSVEMRMSDKEKAAFIVALKNLATFYKRPTYLEWGSGGSTLVANVVLGANSRLASVEHVPEWCDKMTSEPSLAVALLLGKYRYICLQHTLPIVSWGKLEMRKFGTPALKRRAQRVLGDAYVNDGFDAALQHFGFAEELGMDDGSRDAHNTMDFVLIDGRFRVGCALKLLVSDRIRCEDTDDAKATVVVIHDFWIRQEQYGEVLRWYEPIHREDTMGVLRCNQTMSQMQAPRAKELYETFLSFLRDHTR